MTNTEGTEARRSDGEETQFIQPIRDYGRAETKPLDLPRATIGGYRADAVANGLEAIMALRDIPYDLVLMDCQMPEMDGFTATRQIRNPHSGVRNPRVPIVALTSLAGDEAEVSIYLAPGEHGAGAGGDLLAAAERWLALERPAGVCNIRAEVAGDNASSRHMFLSAGYLPDAARFFKRILPDD